MCRKHRAALAKVEHLKLRCGAWVARDYVGCHNKTCKRRSFPFHIALLNPQTLFLIAVMHVRAVYFCTRARRLGRDPKAVFFFPSPLTKLAAISPLYTSYLAIRGKGLNVRVGRVM